MGPFTYYMRDVTQSFHKFAFFLMLCSQKKMTSIKHTSETAMENATVTKMNNWAA